MFDFGGNNDGQLFASGGQISALNSLSLEVLLLYRSIPIMSNNLSIGVYSSLTLYRSVNYNSLTYFK